MQVLTLGVTTYRDHFYSLIFTAFTVPCKLRVCILPEAIEGTFNTSFEAGKALQK